MADYVHWLTPEVAFWETYDSGCRTQVCSCGHVFGSEILLIDPIRLVPEQWDFLLGKGRPAAVLLTNGNHERASRSFCVECRIPLLADSQTGLSPDGGLEELRRLFPGVRTFSLPGAGPGEIAVYRPDVAALSLGDILINLPETGLALLPPKYCREPKTIRKSLVQLDGLNFQIVTFAHGSPLVGKAAQCILSTLLTNQEKCIP